MLVNVDVCLYGRKSRNWVGQRVFTQTLKLLILGPFKVWKKFQYFSSGPVFIQFLLASIHL